MTHPASPTPPLVQRRTLFAGAGAAGALAVVATVLPSAEKAAVKTAAASVPEATGGYQLTDHIKQYYATARI